MKDRMEQEMERTIRMLQASMPKDGGKQASIWILFRIAVSEMSPALLLTLFAAALAFGMVSVKLLSMPMLTAFCTAPMPMLLLFHQYVLGGNEGMRELEATFRYSYAEMLLGRTAVISCYMAVVLLFLSLLLHHAVGEGFLRLVLCGAVPSLYLCALLLFLSGVVHNPKSISVFAIVFWVALCFAALMLPFNAVLQMCSTGVYTALTVIGAIFYSVCFYRVSTRRNGYAFGIG